MENLNLSSKGNANPPKDIWPAIVLGGAAILSCACLIIGGIYLVPYARPYLESTTLVFAPDYSGISEVDRAVLEETARILKERCGFMGCKSMTFTVTENNQIIGKAPVWLNLDIEAIAGKITAIGLLEFTDFGKAPVPEGTIVTTDFENPFLPKGDQKAWHTIMTNAEIASVSVSENQLGQYFIDFTLTEEGTKIFTEYTSNNIGSYLGILLDKVVLSAPVVSSAVTGGQGVIEGGFTEESAKSLAAYLNITPLPIPLILVDVQ